MDYKLESLNLINKNWEAALSERENTLGWLKEQIKLTKKKLCIFCSGETGKCLYETLKKQEIEVSCFSDNDSTKYNKIIVDGKKCISLQQLIKKKEDMIVIVASIHISAVWKQLCMYDFKYLISCYELTCLETRNVFLEDKNKVLGQIESLFNMLEDEESKRILAFQLKSLFEYKNKFNYKCTFEEIYSSEQYMPRDINLNFKTGAFVDCGAYDGDTLRALMNFVDWDKHEYVCYELDQKNYLLLNDNIVRLGQGKRRILTYNLGVGCKAGKIFYQSLGTESRISNSMQDGLEANIVAMSAHLNHMDIGYIKMDIEGSEMDALIGAKMLIQRQKPVLGVCLYHKFADLWEIPLYIKTLMPEYKIYIRHHTNIHLETVCYATI